MTIAPEMDLVITRATIVADAISRTASLAAAARRTIVQTSVSRAGSTPIAKTS